MPRDYYCKKCGVTHQPPTGKKCERAMEEVEEENDGGMLPLMQQMKEQLDRMDADMKEQMGVMNERVKRVEDNSASGGGAQMQAAAEAGVRGDDERSSSDMQALITPASLRNDVRAMERAAQRIAQFRDDDDDDDEDTVGTRTRSSGKKSGSLLVAAGNIKKRIDWPHMYVSRVVNGDRVGVPYKQLRVEEFVYGYLEMLDTARNAWDREVMLAMLKMLMQDAMDFSWSNALNFYSLIGVDVENGTKKWTDTEIIKDMRMIHCRVPRPEKKEEKENKKSSNNKTTSQNLRCCALYQKKACEQNKDHHPFTHACSYCAKATGVAYRHPEDDCFRKALDESKNSKARE